MARTRHIHRLLSRQELSSRIERMLNQYVPERTALDENECQRLLKELRRIKEHLERLAKKGGCVIVADMEREITTYRVDSYQPDIHWRQNNAINSYFSFSGGLK